jgi:cellulose synthase operon protein C
VLEEVFDGPLVRLLLARRAKLRREHLHDPTGAAADLKKLHDLSPNDAGVMAELTALLTELGDYRGMVRVFEDQILRGKDMSARAELARDVARMWEKELADPREAADAWRRVLRMKQGDAEAAAGLERAKANMLKSLGTTADPGSDPDAQAHVVPPVAAEEVDSRTSADGVSEAEPADSLRAAPPAETLDSSGDAGDAHSADVTGEHGSRPLLDSGEQAQAAPSDSDPPADSVVVDFSDTTLPASASDPAAPPTDHELAIDVDASGDVAVALDEEVLLADELDEGVDVQADGPADKTQPPESPPARKRSVPPPLPRGS